jgi:hypothetical protein
MRFIIALAIGFALGYVAFSPDMASIRLEWSAKIQQTIK